MNYTCNALESFEYFEEPLYPLEWITCAIDVAMQVAATNADLDRIQVERLAELRPSLTD